MLDFLLNIFVIPPVIIGVVYWLKQRFPSLIYSFNEPRGQFTGNQVAITILSWFILFVLTPSLLRSDGIHFILGDGVIKNLSQNKIPIVYNLIHYLVDVGYIWFVIRYFKFSLKEIGFRITNWKKIIIVALITSSNILLSYLFLLFGRSPAPFHLSQLSDPLVWLNLLLVGFNIVLYGPIFEEVLFRGLFFRLLRDQMSPFYAWIVQALLFSLAHSFSQFPLLAVGPGLLFGLGVLTTGSLLSGVFSHMITNSTGLLGSIKSILEKDHLPH